MKNVYKKSIILGSLVFVLSGIAHAEDVNLDKIVVTPYRYAESLNKSVSNTTVINQADIKNSNAQNVVDMLRLTPGVVVKDYFGNGTQASVDIAGFGEQAALNVLVLVDGRRVNDIDLSGVDWSQIPLEQVERIEIMRGGSGGVLYGDNASSGVINIITKRGMGEPKVNLGVEYGSYDMNKQKLSLGGGVDDKFSYWLSGERDSTHGYRNNSFTKANNFASKFDYKFSNLLSAHFNSGFNASTYGLPGGLYQSDIDQYSRRYAKYGDDHANKKDYYFLTGTKIEASDLGAFDIDFSFRHKNNDSYFLTSYSSSPTYGGVQNDAIKTFGITPKYTMGNSILGHDNKFIAGVDYYRTDYASDSYALSDNSLVNSTDIRKNSFGSYIQDEFSIFKQLVLVGGYRYELARYVFGYHDNSGFSPDQDTKLRSNQWAFNTGLAYTYQEDSSIFLNVGRSYRFPEIDEFNYYDDNGARQLNTDLKPQSAITYQTGLRHKFSEGFRGNISLFRMHVKDYLYFDATNALGPWGWNGQNENYDKSIHQGIELSLDARLNKLVAIFGNYTFTNSYFDGGAYDKNKIPLVPQHKGSVGLKFRLPRNITLNVMSTYVGRQYALNDQANSYSRLNGYAVVDTNLSWRCKDLTVVFCINNLLDKQYSEYAGVRVSDGARFYYPSPERNFGFKADYAF
jgi:iron complex outermembrane receptor protein